jgi:hypothetical protein
MNYAATNTEKLPAEGVEVGDAIFLILKRYPRGHGSSGCCEQRRLLAIFDVNSHEISALLDAVFVCFRLLFRNS